ncbi:MAG TPA: hypothetical protein PKA82_02965 [Pyrinomonadaceae bacterium]|nr:hypothetical protein [Pyrinomonadaceae bacterium]
MEIAIRKCPRCDELVTENSANCGICGSSTDAKAVVAALNGNAIAKFLVADVFVLPGILLTVLESNVQSNWWLLLATPGLALYVWAAIDIAKSKRIERQISETQ